MVSLTAIPVDIVVRDADLKGLLVNGTTERKVYKLERREKLEILLYQILLNFTGITLLNLL